MIHDVDTQGEVLNQTHLIRKWVDTRRSDYQTEVQFKKTDTLKN